MASAASASSGAQSRMTSRCVISGSMPARYPRALSAQGFDGASPWRRPAIGVADERDPAVHGVLVGRERARLEVRRGEAALHRLARRPVLPVDAVELGQFGL